MGLGDTACVSSQHIGAYQVLRPLARGGMGETLVARSPEGDLVVLKRLLEHLSGDDEARRCFVEELRIAARLDHPNVVRFIESFEHEDRKVLVLEYVDGCSARDLLLDARKRDDPMAVVEACAVVEQASRGLHYAHSLADEQGNPLGLIHRDVSPANILVSRSGAVKLIDFGVAKAWDAESRTATGIVKGKVGYMSPEHTRCETLDGRSDLFSMGIVLWELLVGDRLFVGDGLVGTAYMVLEAPIPKPSGKREDVPVRVDAICMRSLARDLDLRVQSAAELERSLARWREEEGGEVDLGALVRERFPVGLPEAEEEGAPTQVARGRGVGSGVTDLIGGRNMSLPIPPSVPSKLLPKPSELENTDLSSTRFDERIELSMRGVRRRGVAWRVIAVLLATLSIAAMGLDLWMNPESTGGASAKLPPPIFYSYQDADDVQVIVGSLADVPPERRPGARKLDLSLAPLRVEQRPQTERREIGAAVQDLRRRLLGGGRVNTVGEVLIGLALPLGAMLLATVLLFWLLSKLRDGFVRWTLWLLVVFVLGAGLFRTLTSGALGRPGLNALRRSGGSVPMREISPRLRELIEGATSLVPPTVLGKPPPGLDTD